MKQDSDKKDEAGKAIEKLKLWARLSVLCFVVGCIAWLAGFPTVAAYSLVAMAVSFVVAYVYSDVAIFKGKGGGTPFNGL